MKRADISTLDVLEGCWRALHGDNRMSWEIIQERTGAPEKVVYRAMERECGRGYLDWGVSLRTAWLTDKGEDKLVELRIEKGKDAQLMYLGAMDGVYVGARLVEAFRLLRKGAIQ